MKKTILFLWIYLCCSVLYSLPLWAQVVTVSSATVQRGEVFPLSVEIQGVPVGDSVQLFLKYDPFLLFFVEAKGGDGHIMRCTKPTTSFTKEGMLSISCTSLAPSSTGTLVTVVFEALAGRENEAKVEPKRLLVNGADAPNVGLTPGIVTIPGEPVIPQPTESISYNYPNPFGEWTKFSYSVTGDTAAVQFAVYTLTGRKVPAADYSLIKSEGVIEFKPSFNLSNGSYLMQMHTQNGVYQVPFFFIR